MRKNYANVEYDGWVIGVSHWFVLYVHTKKVLHIGN